jgi:hypothetical protein
LAGFQYSLMYEMHLIFFQIFVLISIMVAVFTAPVNLVVDFLFNDILLAPSADSLKEKTLKDTQNHANNALSDAGIHFLK